MKKIIRILLAVFLIAMTTCCASAIPNDSNPLYQTIEFDHSGSENNALIRFDIPTQQYMLENYSDVRFYYENDTPVSNFYIWERPDNETHFSTTIKADVVDGENVFYMTWGNQSFENVSNSSIFDYYRENFSVPSTTTTLFNNTYNSIDMQTSYRPSNVNPISAYFNMSSTGYPYIHVSRGAAAAGSNLQNLHPNATINDSFNYGNASTTARIYSTYSNHTWSLDLYSNGTYNNATYFLDGEVVDRASVSSNSTTMYMTVAGYNSTPFANLTFGNVDVKDSSAVIFNIIDGVEGVVLTRGAEYANASVGSTTAVAVNSSVINAFLNNSTVTITQGNLIQNYSFVNDSTIVAQNIERDTPFTIRINSARTSDYPNISYEITIPEQSPKTTYDIGLFRTITNTTGRVYGIVSDSNGEPVKNGAVVLSYQNGTVVQTVPISDGGEYAVGTANGTYYITYQANGYASVSGGITAPARQDVQLEKKYNISITVIDSLTHEIIDSFTTFLGPEQEIKSTDNGTVEYKNVSGGETEVIIQATGYAQVSKSIFVGDNSTNFTLPITKQAAQEYTTPHYVRLFYRTITGSPIQNLTVTVYEGTGGDSSFEGITGEDGSVSFRLEETIKYRFVASNGLETVHEFSTYPKSEEYIIIIGNVSENEPSKSLSGVSYIISTEDSVTGLRALRAAAVTYKNINVTMRSNNTSDVLSYKITVYQEDSVYETRTGMFSGEKTEYFTSVPTGHVYSVVITFTDSAGKMMTVSKTIRLDSDSLPQMFAIPGFTQQWHYNAFCVFIILISAFTFSAKTAHIGGILIPAEFILMSTIGWMQMNTLAVCFAIAVVIGAIVLFYDRMDKEVAA